MNCSYCGFMFDESLAKKQCESCLVSTGCSSIKCPDCGYEMPEEIQWIRNLSTWWKNRKSSGSFSSNEKSPIKRLPMVKTNVEKSITYIGSPSDLDRPLSQLRPHDSGVVSALRAEDPSMLKKLFALGILPGVSIVLLKKIPSFLFRVGYSEFAIDKELANVVIVEKKL